jgi:hypothetical protein
MNGAERAAPDGLRPRLFHHRDLLQREGRMDDLSRLAVAVARSQLGFPLARLVDDLPRFAAAMARSNLEFTLARLVWALDHPKPHWVLLGARFSQRDREDAARRIAASMATRFRNPAVCQALAGRVGARWWLQEIVFPGALLEAAAERFTERRLRLGRRWVKNRDGKVATVQPMDLPVTSVERWVIQRARTLAEEAILGRLRSACAALRRRPSKREQELLRVLWSGASRSDAALQMRLKRSTIDTLARRLRLKGWPLA